MSLSFFSTHPPPPPQRLMHRACTAKRTLPASGEKNEGAKKRGVVGCFVNNVSSTPYLSPPLLLRVAKPDTGHFAAIIHRREHLCAPVRASSSPLPSSAIFSASPCQPSTLRCLEKCFIAPIFPDSMRNDPPRYISRPSLAASSVARLSRFWLWIVNVLGEIKVFLSVNVLKWKVEWG